MLLEPWKILFKKHLIKILLVINPVSIILSERENAVENFQHIVVVLGVRTMQWRRFCSSGSCQRWQSRNQRRRIGSRRRAKTWPCRRSSRRSRRPCRPLRASTSRRSWTLCTYVPSSISSPWTSSCTHLSPTFRSWPVMFRNIPFSHIMILEREREKEMYKWEERESKEEKRKVPSWKPLPWLLSSCSWYWS